MSLMVTSINWYSIRSQWI